MCSHTGRSADELSALLHLVYGAASNPDQWPGVLQAVAASLHGCSGVLFTSYLPLQGRGTVKSMHHTLDITPEQSMLWATKYLELNLCAHRASERDLVRQVAVITDTDTATEEEFRVSSICRDLVSAMDRGRFCSGVVVDYHLAEGVAATVVTTYRPFSAPPFNQQDRHWLGLLLPHLPRSLGLMQRMQHAQRQQSAMQSALDGLPVGVVLLNAAGQMVHANAAARQVLSRQDGLACSPAGRLDAAPLRNGQPGLADWLRAQRSLLAVDVLHFPEAFLVRRTVADEVYRLQCCPVDNTQVWPVQGQTVACVVFVHHPSALLLPTHERLKGLYGLTTAEARVAHQLAAGLGIKEAAKVLGTSPETIRNQVKSIYQKMRVNSQSNLVRTLLTLGRASV